MSSDAAVLRRAPGHRLVVYAAAPVALAVATVWSAYGTEVSLTRLVTGVPEIINLMERMFPPNTALLPDLVRPTIETLQMALLGTTFPLFFAFPLAFLAAQNTSPHYSVQFLVRMLASFLRTVPDLVWAMIIVSAVGLGPMPGVIALTLHAIGGLLKYFYEAIENVDKGPVEALQVLGASRLQIIVFAVIPNAITAFISSTLLYWEYNNRSAAVLGLVGAGGIGLTMTHALADFRYMDVSICLIVIVFILLVIDQISALVRKRII